jgi:hypothetical protein
LEGVFDPDLAAAAPRPVPAADRLALLSPGVFPRFAVAFDGFARDALLAGFLRLGLADCEEVRPAFAEGRLA